jgi:hypothetical protein
MIFSSGQLAFPGVAREGRANLGTDQNLVEVDHLLQAGGVEVD